MSLNLTELAAAAYSGDKKSYALIYKSTFRSVYFLSNKLLKNAENALEVTKQTYTEAFEIISGGNQPDDIEGWLVRLAAVKCRDFLSDVGERLGGYAENYFCRHVIEDGMEFVPAELVKTQENVSFIIGTVDALPEFQRVAVVLSFFAGMTADNISKLLLCDEGTVASALCCAKETVMTAAFERIGQSPRLGRVGNVSVLTAVLNYEKKNLVTDPETVRTSFRQVISGSGVAEAAAKREKEFIEEEYVPAISLELPEQGYEYFRDSTVRTVYNPEPEEEEEKKPEKNVKKIVAVVLAVLLVIGIVIGAVFLIKNFSERSSGGDDAPKEINYTDHLKEIPSGYVAIRSVEDMQKMRLDPDADYILMNDIDLSSLVNWEPVGSIEKGVEGCFSGVFDGNGYEIKNLRTSGYASAGLFGTLYNAEIVNVTLTNAEIHGDSVAGGIAGECWVSDGDVNAVIANCKVSGKVEGTYNAGGIAGAITVFGSSETPLRAVSEYCENSASVSAENAGGIFGNVSVSSYGEITIGNCINKGDINGTYFSSGLIAKLDNSSGSAVISNCVNAGAIRSTAVKTGAFIGECETDTENSVKLLDCYYVTDDVPSASAVSSGYEERIHALTAQESENKEKFQSLDFENIWKWNGSIDNLEIKEFVVSPEIMISEIAQEPVSVQVQTTQHKSESIVASEADFDTLLELFEAMYDSNIDFDTDSKTADETAYSIVLPEYFTASLYSYFFGEEYEHRYSSDPLNKFGSVSSYEHYVFPAENVDYILTNIFGVEPDHNLNEDFRYFYDGNYYASSKPSGGNNNQFTVESYKMNAAGLYEIEIQNLIAVMGDSEPSVQEIYKVTGELKEVDSKRIWAIHKKEFVSTTALEEVSEDWKTAYHEYLKEDFDSKSSDETNDMSFDLVFINSDNIPELLISNGKYTADTVTVVTFDGKNAVEVGEYGSNGKISYHEKENIIISSYTKNGNSYSTYYRFYDDGTVEEIMESFSNAATADYEDDIVYEIDGVEVSRAEYDEAHRNYSSPNEKSSSFNSFDYDYDSFASVLE